jgi:integrase
MEKRSYKTDREVKALKPSDKWYDVKDEQTRNLIVRVGPARTKPDGGTEFRRTFCLVTRFPGSSNPVRHAFGEYGSDLSLEQARDLADEWRAKIRRGIDPRDEIKAAAEAKRKERDEAERVNKLAFNIVIEDYLKRHVKRQRRAAQVEREIRRELIPAWKDRLVTEITRGDVVALVQDIAGRPAPYQARNVYGHVQTFYNWAIEQGRYNLETSPCDRLKPARIIGEKRPRQRVLNDDEIAVFWRATGRTGYPYGPLMRLLAITGQRKSEVADARWSEFHPELVRILREREDGERIDWSKISNALKVWTVPPDRFKSDASHLVPLTDDALAILETLPHFAGKNTGDHLFSTTFGRKAINAFSKAKERLDRHMLHTLKAIARKRGDDPAKITLSNFVLHDIRRTVRTRLSSLRISDRVAEMVIGHGAKGLQRVYDQHQFHDEMREALELWAGRLRSIVSPPPANVVPMKRERA